MAGITNYSQNQFQYFYKRVAKPSGASGTEIITWAASGVMASGISGISGISGVSSTSYVSGASYVSGTSNISGTSEFTVEGLTINEVVELFTEGNLTVSEVGKWLKANKIEFEFSDNGKTVNFKFTYNNKSYDISCNKEAARSQLDNITQNMFYKPQIDYLKKKYNLDDEQITQYFIIGKAYNSTISAYIINPECGCKDWNELKAAIEMQQTESNERLNDTLFIHGYLESYRDTLYNLDCPPEIHNKIIKELEQELVSYYSENGENGLNNYLGKIFAELINEYNLKTELQKFEEMVKNDDFDKDYNIEEVWSYVDKFIDLISNDLKSKGIYSDEFVEKLINFVQNSINTDVLCSIIDKYGMPEKGNNDIRLFDGTINLKNILNNSINTYKELTELPSTDCNSETFTNSYRNTTGQFLWNLIKDAYNENQDNLNLPTLFDFKENLIKYIAQEYGMIDDLENKGSINFANIINSDTNNDGIWLDEFNSTLTEFIHLNDGINIGNAKKVDLDILFKDKNKLSVSEFVEILDYSYLTQEAGIQKLSYVINNLLDKYNIQNKYDKEDLIKSVIMLINQSVDLTNSPPVTISRNTLEQLNEKGIFDELDKIINSDELQNLYYFGIDEYIDNFGQGETGDCWLLASISALSATESGRQVIRDSISTDEDGNITVTFKGIGISYTITPEEMIEIRNSKVYSFGDNDVLAIERATEKLRHDMAIGNVSIIYGNYTGHDGDEYGVGISGGYPNYMLYYLTGNIPHSEINNNDSEQGVIKFLNSIYEDFNTGNYAGYFTLVYNSEATTIDNKIFDSNIEGLGHVYSIISMTEDNIEIANPYHPDSTFTFTWEEFSKLKPNRAGIVSTEVQEHEYKTSWNNTIDFDSKFTINGKEYSLNDILSSKEPIIFESDDKEMLINNIKKLAVEIASSALSDIKSDIVYNIVNYTANWYYKSLIFGYTFDVEFMDTRIIIDSSAAEENGVYNTENGTSVDIQYVVQKMLELLQLSTREPMTLDEFEEKLQGDEFDREVSKEELNSYLKEYRDALINDLKLRYNYNEKYLQIIDDHLKSSIYNINRDNKCNLKEIISIAKDKCNNILNTLSQECQTADLRTYNGGTSAYARLIISEIYYDNKENINVNDIDQFIEQVIKNIAEKYGQIEELEQADSIDLSKVIPDSNGDGIWMDEFYEIVYEFAHKDDNKVYSNTTNYDKEFEINGKNYTINEIFASDEPITININKDDYVVQILEQLVKQLTNTMMDIQPKLRSNILDTITEYYYEFVWFCRDSDSYALVNGTDVSIHNYITENNEQVHFDLSVAQDYGIRKTTDSIQIDVKAFIQKLLDMINKYS